MLSVMAQDTLDYTTSRYMILRICSPEHGHETCIGSARYLSAKFQGPIYVTNEPLHVYGVAVLTDDPYPQPHTIDGLNVRIAQKEGGIWTVVDSSWWHGKGIDRYYFTTHMIGGGQDSHYVIPVYEVYFNHPIDVIDSFSVGVGRYRPSEGYDDDDARSGPIWNITARDPFGMEISMGTDYPSTLDILINGRLYESHGNGFGMFFPILVPPDTDSYVCAGVDSVRVQGSGTGWVNVAWAPGSEDQELFQIAYGVRGEDPFQYASVINQESPRVIFDDAIDTGVYYSVRVRGRCHHRCAVHDTLMWGPWSEPVHFYVGNHEPGTGIAAPEETPAFSLTPNPTTGHAEVTGVEGQVEEVLVMDMYGRRAARFEGTGTIDVRDLPSGSYIVRIKVTNSTETKVCYRKLIKK